MQTMQTALLVGPYDWDEAIVPRAEFDRRISAALDAARARGFAGLVVHGSSEDNGALAWLTGFTPKLGSGFALLAPGRQVRIITPGAPAMLETARRLTWAEDVHALRDPAKQIADWLGEVAGDAKNGATLGLAGTGTLAGQLYARVTAALPGIENADALVDTLRRTKSPVEQGLLRKAAAILAASVEALRTAHAAGKGARTAALAAKAAAFHEGAQDARLLASAHDGGAPLPLDGTADPACDPLLAHVAVRLAGYWAEGFVTLGKETGAHEHARAALAAAVDTARPGATGAEIARAAAAKLAPYRPHPSPGPAIGTGIGLALAEGPDFAAEPDARVAEGGAYSLKIGAAGNGGDNAVASALILVADGKTQTLWCAA